MAQGLLGRSHHVFKRLVVANGQRTPRQGNKLVAGPYPEPGITGQQIVPLLLLEVELLSRVFQAVVETRATHVAIGQLYFVSVSQRAGFGLDGSRREDDAFALLDRYLEVARHIEVLLIGIASLLVFDILDALVPMGVKYKLGGLVELHVQPGIALVQTAAYAVGRLFVTLVERIVFHTQIVGIAEGKKRTELQNRRGVSIDERILDKDTVLVRDKHFFFRQNHTAHPIHRLGHRLAIKLSNVLVSVRAETVALVLVQTQVKRSAVLNHCLVQRRQHHVIVLIQLGDRNYQQPVLLAGVAIDDSRTMIRARLVGTQHLLGQRPLEVYHQVLVKFQITHISINFSYLCLFHNFFRLFGLLQIIRSLALFQRFRNAPFIFVSNLT